MIGQGYYPLSEEIRNDLKKFQAENNLSDQEVEHISKPIIEAAERDHQEEQPIREQAQVMKGKAPQGQQKDNPIIEAEFRDEKYNDLDAPGHNGIGFKLYNHGKLDEVIAAYRKAIQLDPNYAKAHRNLGCVAKTS